MRMRSGARSLALCPRLALVPYVMGANSEGSDEMSLSYSPMRYVIEPPRDKTNNVAVRPA